VERLRPRGVRRSDRGSLCPWWESERRFSADAFKEAPGFRLDPTIERLGETDLRVY